MIPTGSYIHIAQNILIRLYFLLYFYINYHIILEAILSELASCNHNKCKILIRLEQDIKYIRLILSSL